MVELGDESGGGEGRGSRGRLELKAADEEPREPQTKGIYYKGVSYIYVVLLLVVLEEAFYGYLKKTVAYWEKILYGWMDILK
jgi:hypothetical protein